MTGTYSSPELEGSLNLDVGSVSSPFVDLQRDLATFLGRTGLFLLLSK
jgi:hypothetical protein